MIDKYISRDDFQLIQMDTDSMYIAITDENLIKNEMKEQYKLEKIQSISEEFCQ